MCPSGSRPFGKRESNTNSGNVSSSSRERVNRVPLWSSHHGQNLNATTFCQLMETLSLPKIKGDMFISVHI